MSFTVFQVKIKEATGLPLNLSNFVFCQYTFWDQFESTVAAPVVDPDVPLPLSKDAQFTVTFSHCRVTILLKYFKISTHGLTLEYIFYISDCMIMYGEVECKEFIKLFKTLHPYLVC